MTYCVSIIAIATKPGDPRTSLFYNGVAMVEAADKETALILARDFADRVYPPDLGWDSPGIIISADDEATYPRASEIEPVPFPFT